MYFSKPSCIERFLYCSPTWILLLIIQWILLAFCWFLSACYFLIRLWALVSPIIWQWCNHVWGMWSEIPGIYKTSEITWSAKPSRLKKILREHYLSKEKHKIISLNTELTSLGKSTAENVTDYMIRTGNGAGTS